MKYLVILGDGMADRPISELDNKTPLEYAKTPTMDALAKKGELGLVHTIPEGMKPGSDTANLSVLGYDPQKFYSGRSPLEALSIGVPMKDTDVALRCNIVTLSEEEDAYEKRHMIDHSADEISTEDAAILLDAVKAELETEMMQFYVGTSYRHCLIWDHGKVVELAQPHDILGQCIESYLPSHVGMSHVAGIEREEECLETETSKETQKCDEKAEISSSNFPTDNITAGDIRDLTPEQKEELRGYGLLYKMMKKSYDILVDHPINVERKAKGLHPANSCWFWGAGTKPALSSFEEKTGKTGAMISAVDLLKGIAVGASMKVIEVEGANGGLHTNYEGKAQAAIDALLGTEEMEPHDFVYVHLEGPDEMGHQGSVEKKVQAIEWLDERVIKPIVDGLNAAGEDFRMLILPDHPTPICIRTHSSEPVPYVLYDSTKEQQNTWNYNEKEAEVSGNYVAEGHTIIDKLFEK